MFCPVRNPSHDDLYEPTSGYELDRKLCCKNVYILLMGPFLHVDPATTSINFVLLHSKLHYWFQSYAVIFFVFLYVDLATTSITFVFVLRSIYTFCRKSKKTQEIQDLSMW